MNNGLLESMPGEGTLCTEPILSVWLREFDAGITALEWDPSVSRKQAAQRLCELSRDILFRVGRPEDTPPTLLRRIVRLFRAAIASIDAAHCEEDLSAYSQNIAERAKDLKDAGLTVPV